LTATIFAFSFTHLVIFPAAIRCRFLFWGCGFYPRSLFVRTAELAEPAITLCVIKKAEKKDFSYGQRSEIQAFIITV